MVTKISDKQNDVNKLQAQINNLKKEQETIINKINDQDVEKARLENVIIGFEEIINKWRLE